MNVAFELGQMSVEQFAERLRELQGDSSGRGFAQTLGLKSSTYQSLLKGVLPTLDTFVTICAATGVELTWLATGDGSKWRSDTGQSQSQSFGGLSALANDFAMIPRLDVVASAGNGSVIEQEEVVELVAFRTEWLSRRGISAGSARAMTVKGDSMEPTIRSGDLLLLDTSRQRIEDNGIYVVVSNGYVQVKRIHPRQDGSIVLISDNSFYPSEEIPASEAMDFRVAGRVMWFGRSI